MLRAPSCISCLFFRPCESEDSYQTSTHIFQSQDCWLSLRQAILKNHTLTNNRAKSTDRNLTTHQLAVTSLTKLLVLLSIKSASWLPLHPLLSPSTASLAFHRQCGPMGSSPSSGGPPMIILISTYQAGRR